MGICVSLYIYLVFHSGVNVVYWQTLQSRPLVTGPAEFCMQGIASKMFASQDLCHGKPGELHLASDDLLGLEEAAARSQ